VATYILNDEKMFSDIADGIAIIINSETGIYYGMNGFGSNVFENILNGADTVAILNVLKDAPGAPENMGNRLDEFVALLLSRELILQREANGEANVDVEIAKSDNFILEIKEYNDAQELLLADPIHEVKQDSGWSPDKDSIETDEEEIDARKTIWKEDFNKPQE
jgi:hypothetical protein